MVEWWRIVVACVCLVLSGTFSGLTLGLMSLSVLELRVLTESGDEKEKKHAERIMPIRKQGNFLLCSLLIGNTAVNAALSIVTADLFGGILGFLLSTISILYLGEIIPQSVCHKYGLVIGAFAVPIVKVFMILTSPLSWPTAKLLDWFLGDDSDEMYSKKQLRSLLHLHGEPSEEEMESQKRKNNKKPGDSEGVLSREEVAIFGAAFDFGSKTVGEVMTPINKVFMLKSTVHLDFNTLRTIFQSGHSRIPVYENDRSNIIGLLFVKDLILIDPDDSVHIRSVLRFFGRTFLNVATTTNLFDMLSIFKKARGHFSLVQKGQDSGSVSGTIGVVTLEDIIEELIGDEIVDETDVYTDNSERNQARRKRSMDSETLQMLTGSGVEQALSSREARKVAAYLTENMEEFSSELVKPDILEKHLLEAIVEEYSSKEKDPLIYKQGVPAFWAYFILNGSVKIQVGKNEIESEIDSYSLIGKHTLFDDIYAPNYTARGGKLPLRILRLPKKLYRSVREESGTLNLETPMLPRNISLTSPTVSYDEVIGMIRTRSAQDSKGNLLHWGELQVQQSQRNSVDEIDNENVGES